LKLFDAGVSKINKKILGHDLDYPKWQSDWHNHLSI
jgi:hypothetical protein